MSMDAKLKIVDLSVEASEDLRRGASDLSVQLNELADTLDPPRMERSVTRADLLKSYLKEDDDAGQ